MPCGKLSKRFAVDAWADVTGTESDPLLAKNSPHREPTT